MAALESKKLGAVDFESLVKRAQDGDRNACEELVGATTGLVKKITYSTVGRQLCEDAYQETYLIVFRKIRQLKNPSAFPGWVGRIALHVCYDLRKRVKFEEELPEHSSSPDQADSIVEAMSLHKALFQLHDRDRDVILLREFLDLSYEQVAQALRVPVGTVRSRLNNARKTLLKRLSGK